MSDIQAIRADLDRVQMELDMASARGVGHSAHGDLFKLVRHGQALLSALTAAEARAEAAEARVLKLLEDYAASIESMSCKEYLVDKLAATGVSANVTLAYGRVQGIRMAADKIRASRTLKGTPDGR